MSGIDVAEANAQTPRKARFDDDLISVLGFMLFFLALWLVPAVWGAHDDIRDSHIRDVLRREGSEVNAEVTKSYAGRRSVDVLYKFSVAGILYSGRAELIAGDHRAFSPGNKISIRYLPKDPHVNQPVNWGWFSVGKLIFYLMGLGLIAGIGVCIFAGLRQKQLTRMGLVVEGRVTGCSPSRNRFTVYYEFTTEQKVSLEGKTEMSEECEAGDSIPVMYLRSNPKRNDYYPE